MALSTDPATLGLTQGGREVWGFVMDTGMPEGWYTVVALADGTASLYTSAAFGVIGAGTHESVAAAREVLLAASNDSLDLFDADRDASPPAPGVVVMRALTFDGRRAVIASEEELGNGGHPASSVFYAAHAVITAIRHVTPPE